MVGSNLIRELKILPQYGAVSAPFFSEYRGLLNPGATSAPSSAPALITPHPADRFLATSPEDALNATYQMQPHQVVAALDSHKDGLVVGVDYKSISQLIIGPSPGCARLTFTEHGVAIRLDVTPEAVKTTYYVITTDTKGLGDFLRASLRHYTGVPDALQDGVSDLATATGDDLLLAASLIFHQQFVQQSSLSPFVFQSLAVAASVQEQLDSGQEGEHVWVPSLSDDSVHPVEIRRGPDGRIVIKIKNTISSGAPNMPLFGNVLSLAAREMLPELKAMPLVDFMAADIPQ